ncbi:hypothetical protein H9P43_008646 [Blastocladiella emersonii ATCC 22665]|nr:hypothetical protein H9P43_008646 [Blastocladiella emersonii ATCC 22665]
MRSIYHDKLLRGPPTDRSALPSSPHSAAYSFMVKLHRPPLPSPTALKVHLLESAVEQLKSINNASSQEAGLTATAAKATGLAACVTDNRLRADASLRSDDASFKRT